MKHFLRIGQALLQIGTLTLLGAVLQGCAIMTPVRDGILEFTVENYYAQDVRIEIERQGDLGSVSGCKTYTFAEFTIPPVRHTMRIEVRDSAEAILYDRTVDVDPTKGTAKVAVRVPEAPATECQTMKVSAWPTPPLR